MLSAIANFDSNSIDQIESIRDNNTAAGTNTVLRTVAEDEICIVTSILVTCDYGNTVAVGAQVGFGTADGSGSGDKCIADHPGIPAGGGFVKGNGGGVVGVGGKGKDLVWTNEVPTSGSVSIVVDCFVDKILPKPSIGGN